LTRLIDLYKYSIDYSVFQGNNKNHPQRLLFWPPQLSLPMMSQRASLATYCRQISTSATTLSETISAVPVPAALWSFMGGIMGFLALAKQRKQS
jgi:hypothetical protein